MFIAVFTLYWKHKFNGMLANDKDKMAFNFEKYFPVLVGDS